MILIELFWDFFVIGAFCFGGGYAMLPLIQRVVLDNGWLSNQELINFIAVSESTPGPLAVNMSTYIGMRIDGIAGAFMATLGIVVPSFFVILIVSCFYDRFQKNMIVKGILGGIQPAIVAFMFTALISVVSNVFSLDLLLSKDNICSGVILLIGGVLCYHKAHPILIILCSGFLGVLFGFL